METIPLRARKGQEGYSRDVQTWILQGVVRPMANRGHRRDRVMRAEIFAQRMPSNGESNEFVGSATRWGDPAWLRSCGNDRHLDEFRRKDLNLPAKDGRN